MKFKFNPLTDNLDLVNENIKAVASDPASGKDLEMIFNTATSQLKIFYQSVWYTLHTLTIPGNLLLEDGDYLLSEIGEYISLES